MLPTQEGFEAGNPARLEFYDGLIFEEEFVAFHGAAQISLNLRLPFEPLAGSAIEYFIKTFAPFLRAIHCCICMPQDLFRIDKLRRTQRHADAGSDEQLAAGEMKRFFEHFLYPLDRKS